MCRPGNKYGCALQLVLRTRDLQPLSRNPGRTPTQTPCWGEPQFESGMFDVEGTSCIVRPAHRPAAGDSGTMLVRSDHSTRATVPPASITTPIHRSSRTIAD